MPNISQLPVLNIGSISSSTYFLAVDQRVATRIPLATLKIIIENEADLVFTRQSYANAVSKPLHSTSTGAVGQVSVDADYVYICVDTNTWRRVPASTF